jgi:hypothetical protein
MRGCRLSVSATAIAAPLRSGVTGINHWLLPLEYRQPCVQETDRGADRLLLGEPGSLVLRQQGVTSVVQSLSSLPPRPKHIHHIHARNIMTRSVTE